MADTVKSLFEVCVPTGTVGRETSADGIGGCSCRSCGGFEYSDGLLAVAWTFFALFLGPSRWMCARAFADVCMCDRIEQHALKLFTTALLDFLRAT